MVVGYREGGEVAGTIAGLVESGLPPHLMIDCSHGNSLKDFRRQPGIAAQIADRVAAGSREIAAVMIESNLVEGSQPHLADRSRLIRGCSITDACIGWEATVGVLEELAAAARRRGRA
jgi:3-deoxy-7-phosphoheptulonate synthase